MNNTIKEIVWQQFGASIDMLENAITACPDAVWGNKMDFNDFWYITFHALFWLDFYSSESAEHFAPPPPFGIEEFDPQGLFPERIYTKNELLNYLNYCRNKCQNSIAVLTDEKLQQYFVFGTLKLGLFEIKLYNMRHVQHHTAQLNHILRQRTGSAPRWVRQSSHIL